MRKLWLLSLVFGASLLVAEPCIGPGGGGIERYSNWGEEGPAKIRDFIKAGGCCYGTCARLAVMLKEPNVSLRCRSSGT